MDAEPALWPRPLRPGGTIGICSPSGPSSRSSLDRAAAALQARGYRVVLGSHAADTSQSAPYLAGDDTARAADLNAFLADGSIDLILCGRGGYGAMRLLDNLDYAAARRDPKPLVGYSDITALSLALWARANVVSFSGIMATAGHGLGETTLDPWSEQSLWDAVGPARGPRTLCSPADEGAPWQVHRGGAHSKVVSGPLVPVCLTLLTSLVGTPFMPDLRGAILVIEDIHEELYAVDRALTQLCLAGLLDHLAAILIGSFNGTSEDEDAVLARNVPRLCCDLSPAFVVVVSGVAYGHIARRLTLPVGARARVDLAAQTFTFV